MKKLDYGNDRVFGNIMRAMLPMLAAQVLSLLYSIVDRIYIGRIPGEGTVALGGVGLCFPVIIMITAFTNLYGTGGAPLFSIALGKQDTDQAKDIIHTAFRLEVLTAVILMLLGEAFAPAILRIFRADADSLVYALPYLRIYLLGTVFTMVATGMNPYINAQGFPALGMMTVVIGAVANIALDPLFIFVLGMGVRGAAVATVISQGLSFLFVLAFFGSSRSMTGLSLFHGKGKPMFAYAGSIVSLGLASFVMQFTNALVQVSCNGVLMHFGGPLYVSVMTIISSVRQIVDTPVMAVGEGTSPLISYNYGAGKPGNVRRGMLFMTLIGLSYTAAVWGLILCFPRMFIRIFTADRELVEAAVPALHMYFFAFIFQSLQVSGQTVFKSMNKKGRAIFFSLFRKVVMVVPLTYLLPYAFGMGTRGVFMAEPISNFVGGCACFTTMLLTILPELKRMDGMKTNTEDKEAAA